MTDYRFEHMTPNLGYPGYGISDIKLILYV